jgi:hypothetical protein
MYIQSCSGEGRGLTEIIDIFFFFRCTDKITALNRYIFYTTFFLTVYRLLLHYGKLVAIGT